jgi:hypothetical protein
MKTLLFGAALLAGVTAQSPAPYATDSGAPFAAWTTTVLCRTTPLYLWNTRDLRPYRSYASGQMHTGQRVTIISDVRRTLSNFDLYETDIPVVESGPYTYSAHYWITTDCVPPPPKRK